MWETVGVIAAFIGLIYFLKGRGEKISELSPPGGVPMPEKPAAPTLDDLYQRHGKQKGLDPMLLKAIAQVESSENPNAKNPADPSVGLMQVLCVPDGSGGCKNKFNIKGWPPDSEKALYDPDLSLHFGAQILKWNLDTYGMPKGIAVYNNWSARQDPQEGPFRNQGYVDKVLGKYYALRPSARPGQKPIYA